MDRRIAGQSEACVIVLDAKDQFGEVIATDAARCVLLLPNGQETFCTKAELADGRMRAVPVTKIIKGDGTWMYYAPGTKGPRNPTGTQWFTLGGVFV